VHLGHALNNTLQDILTRWRRMAGDNAVWMPGTDHAGIATQTVVEKRVLAEEGKRRTDFQRDEFVKKIQAWKDDYEARITNQLKLMGCSCDWDRQAFTMDEPRARAVREAFFQLFKDGLIYRGKRLVNWDPATQTALADDEVEMEEIDGHFYYLRYPLEREPSGSAAGPEYVTVATTRPETMLGDTAVAINPKDPRAAALRGKFVRLPIVNRVIPIIEDDYVVLPDENSDDAKAKFATGFLKVTPAHDPNDYDIGLRHKLPMINVLAPDGSISDQHGWPKGGFFAGRRGPSEFARARSLRRPRRAVVEWFKRNNLLENVKPYRHSVGHSYRSHVPIEPYLSDQWYCKVTDERLAGAALRAMSRRAVRLPSSMAVSAMSSKEHGRGRPCYEVSGRGN
jgi:valyl-tRNA synthetase